MVSGTPRDVLERRSSESGDEGYTLLEMILVVAILGVLASVVVIAVSGMRTDAAASSCDADARLLAVAAESYYAEAAVDAIPATGADDDRFERTLVDAGLLRGLSASHDLGADGAVTPEEGSPC